MASNEFEILNWDAEINQESEVPDYPEGDYDFSVTNVERAMHDGTGGIPVECPKFIVTYRVSNGQVSGPIRDTFYCVKKYEWKLSAFMLAVGLKHHGEPINLQKFTSAVGMTGRCRLAKSKDGKYTNINKYYENKPAPTQGYTFTAQQMPQQFAQPQQTQFAQPQMPNVPTYAAPAQWQQNK